MGRWGNELELTLAIDILRQLGAKRVLGGLNQWINLRTYPAVLRWYAFGIGALKGARYKALFEWTTAPIDQENKQTKAAVQSLFSLAWITAPLSGNRATHGPSAPQNSPPADEAPPRYSGWWRSR
jgi:hypothetical protein